MSICCVAVFISSRSGRKKVDGKTTSMAEKTSRQFDILFVFIDMLFASGVRPTSVCCVAVFISSRSGRNKVAGRRKSMAETKVQAI